MKYFLLVTIFLAGCASVQKAAVPNEVELEGSTGKTIGQTDRSTNYGILLRGRWKIKE